VSERTLDSSPRLVGGVDIGGDAVEEDRKAGPFLKCAVMEEVADEIDVGDVSRPAMVAVDDTGWSSVVKEVFWVRGGSLERARGPGAGGPTGLTGVTLRKCGCNWRPTGSKTPPDTRRGLHEPLQRELKTDRAWY
jgi:hypothetical protein